MFAETGSEECLSLVATCYYRAGNLNQAYHTLKVQGGAEAKNSIYLYFMVGTIDYKQKLRITIFLFIRPKIGKITPDENNLNKPNIEDKNNKMNLYFLS